MKDIRQYELEVAALGERLKIWEERRNDVSDILHTTEPWELSEREKKIMAILDGDES